MAVLRNETEMFPLVESWQQSGLTQKAFSEQHQIPEYVFTYWVSKYRKKHQQDRQNNSEDSSTSFIRLSTPAQTSATVVSTAGMEVALPTGVVIRFSSTVPVTYLQQLLSVCSP